MEKIPKRFKKFTEDYPKVAKAYERLGDEVHAAGPLDEKTRALVKLGISVGARLEGAVHSHVRKAIEAGGTADEVRHVVLLSMPTIGLPPMMRNVERGRTRNENGSITLPQATCSTKS
jgi:alkylhydroperoxidase/carboxymuconolactone decarboxylase family protein YurZ